MPNRLFSFLNPLAIEIWLYMAAAYVVVSLTIWIVARFSPYEWCDHQPCAICEETYEDDCYYPATLATLLVSENDFTLGNSFWFTIGTLMQQGSDLNPKVIFNNLS